MNESGRRTRRQPAEMVANLRQADEAPAPYRDKLVSRMRELAVLDPRRGRRHMMDLLHREGWTIGTRLVKPLCRVEGLQVSQNCRKRRRAGTGESGNAPRRAARKYEVWGLDFVSDRAADGRPFRGEDVTAVLDVLTATRRSAGHHRCDNGPGSGRGWRRAGAPRPARRPCTSMPESFGRTGSWRAPTRGFATICCRRSSSRRWRRGDAWWTGGGFTATTGGRSGRWGG